MEHPDSPSGAQDADNGRHETLAEQSDRNWTDLLQELRVMQTGTQIIAGFLLTLPFQQRFAELGPLEVALYLCLVVVASLATCLMLVPVAAHRALFGLRVKVRLVASGHRIVKIVLWLVGILVLGTSALIFQVVLGPVPAIIIAVAFTLGVLASLFFYPQFIRSKNLDTGHKSG